MTAVLRRRVVFAVIGTLGTDETRRLDGAGAVDYGVECRSCKLMTASPDLRGGQLWRGASQDQL